MKNFDMHVHHYHKTDFSVAIENFKTGFDLSETEKMCFLSIPTYLDGDILENLKALYFKDNFAPNAYAYAGLFYNDFDLTKNKKENQENFLTQVKTYHKSGFDGLKILEGKPSERKKIKVMLSDPVFEKVFAYLEENAIPVNLHNSDPATFWDLSKMTESQIKNGWYCGDVASKKELFNDVMTVLKRHPNLNLTMAHFGFTSDDIDEAREFFSYKNTKFDICPGGEQYVNVTQNYDEWKSFIYENVHRFKFGTDVSNTVYDVDWKFDNLRRRYGNILRFLETDDVYQNNHGEVKGIKLPEDKLKMVMYDNALNELKTPKPIDLDYVFSEIKRIEPLLKTEWEINTLKVIKEYFLNK